VSEKRRQIQNPFRKRCSKEGQTKRRPLRKRSNVRGKTSGTFGEKSLRRKEKKTPGRRLKKEKRGLQG